MGLPESVVGGLAGALLVLDDELFVVPVAGPSASATDARLTNPTVANPSVQ